MLGYTSTELLQHNSQEITHPLDRSMNRKLFNSLINGKRRSYYIEKRYLNKDGDVVWCRVTTSVVDGPDGQVQYVIAMVENFTARSKSRQS